MHGLMDEDIKRERSRVIELLSNNLDEPFDVIDTMNNTPPDEDMPERATRLHYFAQSIGKLGKADLIIFIGDWEKYPGCRCEHYIAEEYGIPIINDIWDKPII